MTAIVVLGMHRSGTSCLAGMLAASGALSAGPAVRNWDNARGHFEALALVRLNEAVLARSGGHWLAAPAQLCWTKADEQEREQLLGRPIDGRAPLLKDPRTLLVLRFWRASPTPFHAIGIVRHPAAVARSLASWRGIPLAEGMALWLAHNRALRADAEQHATPLVDFEASAAEVSAAVARACAHFGLPADAARLRAAYDERLVHHDELDSAGLPGIEQALRLYDALRARAGTAARARRRPYPRAELDAFERQLLEGELPGALEHARAALAGARDAAAVLVPVVSALLRRRAHEEARTLLGNSAPALEPGLHELLLGKVLLAAGDARGAAAHLARACAQESPLYQARRLLPHALRAAGRREEARRALAELAPQALYPHGPWSVLAEWAWSDGDRRAALAHMATAIEAAPPHRRGRMRTRRAEWLAALGERAAAGAELARALEEDPTYPRARAALERLRSSCS